MTLEYIYTTIYNNIGKLKETYDNVLNPETNNTTKQYIDDGYSTDEAYTLSFMVTLLLYFQIYDIIVDT